MNLMRMHIVCIHKLIEIVIISKYQDFLLQSSRWYYPILKSSTIAQNLSLEILHKSGIGNEYTPPRGSIKINQATILKIQFLNNPKR